VVVIILSSASDYVELRDPLTKGIGMHKTGDQAHCSQGLRIIRIPGVS